MESVLVVRASARARSCSASPLLAALRGRLSRLARDVRREHPAPAAATVAVRPRVSSASFSHFGSLDHLYVVFESEDAIGDHGDLVDHYVEALRRAPEIESVDAQLFEPGKDWSYLLRPRAVPARRRRRGGGARPLRAAATRRRDRARARPPVDAVGADQGARAAGSARAPDDAARSHGTREGDSPRSTRPQEGYVSPDGHSRLVMVKPKGRPSTPTSARRSSPDWPPSRRRLGGRRRTTPTPAPSRSRPPARIASRSRPNS